MMVLTRLLDNLLSSIKLAALLGGVVEALCKIQVRRKLATEAYAREWRLLEDL